MSEYQYYEFQAVDRSLSKQEMAELRAISTRAKITPRRFVNVYNFGDFGGSPSELMDKYFDAFVYIANWGSREFMLRLPRGLLDPKTVEPYCAGDWATIRAVDDFTILEITCYDEWGGELWMWGDESEGWLPTLLPLREELATGDLRCLYLGWLLSAQAELDDDEVEPPVPPGLGNLSPAQRAFAEFFWIDEALIEIAAERSADLQAFDQTPEQLQQWIHDLPNDEKDALLLQLATDGDTRLRAELLRRFQQSTRVISEPTTARPDGGRTVEQLLAAAEQRAEVKQREADEREARERARQAEEQARARAIYLDDLAGRAEDTWNQVETLIEAKRAKEYEQAVELLRDLHDLAVRTQKPDKFSTRYGDLRDRHATKHALLKRLKNAGL